MPKVILTVTGVVAFYPTGQQNAHHTLKAGQQVEIMIGDKPEPKTKLPARAAEDMGAPAVGVATDEPYGEREGSVTVSPVDGAVALRVYDGADFQEETLAAGDTELVPMTESNKITLALYPAEPEPK